MNKTVLKLKRFNNLKQVFLLSVLLFINIFSAYSQEHTVSGKVADEDNQPMPGVNIIIQGTTRGITSSIDGTYSLSEVPKNAVLIFSFIGYESKEVAVNNQTTINVNLQPDVSELDEVVVIGYGTQKKSDLTGSVVSVSADDLQETPNINLGDALKGRAAGVVISGNSGLPGSSPSILIRGSSSIFASNEPLVIVDGLPSDISVLNSINMNDVKSFEILKDASATAIYGAQGANGVILISTKRGVNNQNSVDFSAKYGTRHFPKPKNLLNSEEFFDYIKDLGVTTDIYSDKYYVNWDAISLSTIDTTNLANINWQDQMFDVGQFQEYSLALSGGSEKQSYRVSGSYVKDEGIISPAQFERYTFMVAIDNQLSKRLKLSGTANFTHSKRTEVNDSGLGWNGGIVNAALQYPPLFPIKDDITGYYFPNLLRPQVDSPLALSNGVSDKNQRNSLVGNINLGYEIFDGFTFRSELLANVDFNRGKSFRDRNNTYDGRVYNGRASDNTSYSISTTIHSLLQYVKTFGEHEISLLAGNIYNQSYSESVRVGVIDFPTNYMVLLSQANNREFLNDGIAEFKTLAYISRVFYQYKSKYLFQANFRADGSPKFGPNKRWGYFPSASIGWKISEEDFFDVSNIDMLKLRFSVGSTGNDGFARWQWMSTYGMGGQGRSFYPIYGNDSPVAYVNSQRLANPDLKWESSFEYNLGADLSAYKGRLNINLDLYNKRSFDLLYSKPIPNTSGYGSVFVNIGEVRNRGIEVAVTTRNFSNSNFLWKTEATLSYNQNEVIDLGETNEGIMQNWAVVEGEPLQSAWLYEQERLFQNDDFNLIDGKYVLKQEFAKQPNAQPGDIKFKNIKDVDSDGNGVNEYIIDQQDRVFLGPSNPPWSGGINNTFSYKNLSLSFFFQGVYGNYIYNATRVTSEGMNDIFNQYTTVLNRWTPNNTNTSIPRATLTDTNQNNRPSDRWLEPGWYVRLRDITLSYSIPNHLISFANMQGASVYVTGQNWLTITDYSGYDPEVGNTDNGTYPQVRTVLFGFNLKF